MLWELKFPAGQKDSMLETYFENLRGASVLS